MQERIEKRKELMFIENWWMRDEGDEWIANEDLRMKRVGEWKRSFWHDIYRENHPKKII